MASSEERREVAARLREAKRECESRGYPWMTDDLILALGYRHDYEADDSIFDRLAELIEPDEPDVIRCRDCAFFGESDDMSFSPWCWRDPDHTGHGEPTDEDDYCSRAEPREEAGDGD